MQISMRNHLLKYLGIGICLIFSGKSFSQSPQALSRIGLFLNDGVMYSDKYITPATDAAVYQSSSGWMTSPKKRKLYAVTLGIYSNAFFVPQSDRNFEISNSDFSFFTIQDLSGNPVSTTSGPVTMPTSLGGQSQYYLVGQLDDNNQIIMESPNGVNQESIIYPYLQGSISLWKGFEFAVKYSTKVNLKRGNYQVYGFALKHNLTQYFSGLNKRKINLAALIAYSKEDISFDFIDPITTFGTLGISKINGLVSTTQFQMSVSKEWKNFELMFSSIANYSDFKYEFGGEKGTIDEVITINNQTVREEFNKRLQSIYKNKYIGLVELSGRYQFSKFYVQSSVAFGKFVNTNLSVQYEF